MATVAQILSARSLDPTELHAMTGYVQSLTSPPLGEPQWGTCVLEATDDTTLRVLVPESLIVQVGDRVLILIAPLGNFLIVRLSQPAGE